MKHHYLKLLLIEATFLLMGQEVAAQVVYRWEIPGLKKS